MSAMRYRLSGVVGVRLGGGWVAEPIQSSKDRQLDRPGVAVASRAVHALEIKSLLPRAVGDG